MTAVAVSNLDRILFRKWTRGGLEYFIRLRLCRRTYPEFIPRPSGNVSANCESTDPRLRILLRLDVESQRTGAKLERHCVGVCRSISGYQTSVSHVVI